MENCVIAFEVWREIDDTSTPDVVLHCTFFKWQSHFKTLPPPGMPGHWREIITSFIVTIQMGLWQAKMLSVLFFFCLLNHIISKMRMWVGNCNSLSQHKTVLLSQWVVHSCNSYHISTCSLWLLYFHSNRYSTKIIIIIAITIWNNKHFSVTQWLMLQPQSVVLMHCMGCREDGDS